MAQTTAIQTAEYRIDDVRFADTRFTASSPRTFDWPDSVAYAARHTPGTVLQSAAEAIAMRIALERKGPAAQDHSEDAQTTRTAAVYFREGDRWYAAFDDIVDPAQNLLLARTDEGCQAHMNYSAWRLPRQDSLVKGTIQRAGRDRRIVELHGASFLELRLIDQDENPCFAGHPLIDAMVGSMAGAYATFLLDQGYARMHINTLPPDSLEKELRLDDAHVEVRPVRLERTSSYSISARCPLSAAGYARGVRDTPGFLR